MNTNTIIEIAIVVSVAFGYPLLGRLGIVEWLEKICKTPRAMSIAAAIALMPVFLAFGAMFLLSMRLLCWFEKCESAAIRAALGL